MAANYSLKLFVFTSSIILYSHKHDKTKFSLLFGLYDKW